MNVAFIPVRGGSKSIPLKNIKLLNGKPLVYWTLIAACGCDYIDQVYVATDSVEIRDTIKSFRGLMDEKFYKKIIVIDRSAESASDTASTEFAMLEFAQRYDFDNITLIQATSPLLTSADLNRGFESFHDEDTDCVLSVVRQKRFHWENDDMGFAHPTNYDVFNRPRRQNFSGYLVENGAFYISSKSDLLKSKNRISGKIKTVEMSEETYYEIDELSDWIIIESMMKKKEKQALENQIPEIKMFLTDCDGCLTDGGMYYSENGDELKKFNTRDGMGFSMLNQNRILTGIITSENVDLNRRRAEKLKLDILELGCKDKVTVVKRLCEENNISLSNVAYIGDDINDVEVLKVVGYGCCPSDAEDVVKSYAKYITTAKGGEGVIREVVNNILDKKKDKNV